MDTDQPSDIYAETLAVFDRREDRCEPLTTPEVAEELDANRRTVYKRLRTLADREEVETKTVGANARVWWRPGKVDGAGDAPAPELKRRSRMMTTASDGIAITDEDGEYVYVNRSHVDVYGYDDESAFLGENWRMCYAEDELDRFDEEILPTLYEEGSWRGEALGQRKGGTTFPQELSLTVDDDGGIICVVRDVAERKERERRLREANRFSEELVENAPFGMYRLDEDLRITYENPRAEEIIGLPEEKDSSDAIGVDIRKLPPIVETGQADLFTRLRDGDTVEFDFPFESIYGKEAYFTGRAVPLYRDGDFDGAILMATDISERRQYERELERQREQLAAIDELNDIVRRITEAVLEQSTRDEIERVACERLAESDSYCCAWIGAVDPGPEPSIRADAGVEDDPEFAARGGDDGLFGNVIRTEEMHVARTACGTGSGDGGEGSVAAIPVAHQGLLYGVLGVRSERSDAFAEAEREVIGQLGDVIGHAIAAVERKRALMGEEAVELELQLSGILEGAASADGTATIDRVTPLGDDEYLAYGTATGDAVEAIRRVGERRASWKELRTFDEREDGVRFEQRLSDPPLASVVADYGGNVKAGRIENGTYNTTIQFPPGTNVRRVVERLREVHLDVRIVSQRQVSREHPSSRHVLSVLAEDLTERQRVALEAGYFGGFFECPRHRSGEEIAESLDIGASTFHQHVRKAEGKLLDAVFEKL